MYFQLNQFTISPFRCMAYVILAPANLSVAATEQYFSNDKLIDLFALSMSMFPLK